MSAFAYSFPTIIQFGQDSVSNLSRNLRGKKATNLLMVYGKGSIFKNNVYNDVIDQLKQTDIQVHELSNCPDNPDIAFVSKGIDCVKKENIDFLLAVGGGSVIDATKAIGLFSQNMSEDYWQNVLDKGKNKNAALPIGVVLTSFGTGSEGNGSFVISNAETLEKVGQSHLSVRPQFAVCDPRYTFSLPARQVSLGITDTVSHLLEQYFSLEESDFLDGIIVAVLKNVLKNADLEKLGKQTLASRGELMLASTFSLSYFLSLGKTLDWSPHKIEHAVSGVYDIPHAQGLACIFPAWIEVVSDNDTILKKIRFLLQELDIKKTSTHPGRQLAHFLRDFFTSLGLSVSLQNEIPRKLNVKAVVETTLRHGSLGKLYPLSSNDIAAILLKAA